MRAAIVFVSTLAVASAGLVAPLGLAPTVLSGQASQYHAQDELGQYSYGYSGGPSSKVETKTADGVVRGAYSYIDGNGLIQSVNYVADPINGFRTAATNLPVGPAPAPAQLVAARTIAAPVGAVVAHPGLAYSNHHLLAAPALVGVGAPIYHAAAAPLHNGAVHTATLPVAPAHTPEVVAATLSHLAAKARAG